MKQQKLTKEQKEELEKFGANTWFVEQLHDQFQNNPDSLPEQWQNFFGSVSKSENQNNGNKQKQINYPLPGEGDEQKIIAGSAARILDNMENSLTIPTATSQRTIPVKLLEENRILINNHLKKTSGLKISFTHLIAWAIIQSIKQNPALNNAFSIVNGKPIIIKRKNINLGLAIDIEKKDGTRSLLVPNIKNVERLKFSQFISAYDDIVERSRTGNIDPNEFLGTTVTLTNPGTIGTVGSIPRLMIGQGVIIATGAIQYPAEYQAMSPETISTLGISKVLTITSTYDHRIIQGAESGFFLKEIHDLLLGKKNFYENIFDNLKIPLKPISWETDIHIKGFGAAGDLNDVETQARVLQLINMYRVRGHLIANIDPLGAKTIYHQELDPSFHKLTLWDLDRTFITGGFGNIKTATLREILGKLQRTYCEKIGVEYMHIQNPEEKTWLQNQMEPTENKPNLNEEDKERILNKLIEAEHFEHFIHNKFIGHKRFSLEGSETVIPVLDHILSLAAEENVEEIVFGMAHRGRLNILANVIGKSYDSIFSEFEDIRDPDSFQGSGDVKYHLGATGKYITKNNKSVNVSIASNPSHLEWVNPVVEGIVRAKQTRKNDTEKSKIIPLLLHGDAAFAGQGVVSETLNLSQLSGYRTGGTIHIVINNQIGFTTTPEDARSSVYATDAAKIVQAPIIHVNGDDPEAALWAAELAFKYRQKFHKDVVIDLLGYRRHGHNEGDEPGFTQPLLYEKIKNHPSVLNIYSNLLLKEKVINDQQLKLFINKFNSKLDESLNKVKKKHFDFKIDIPLAVSKDKIKSVKPSHITAVKKEILNEIILRGTTVPPDFNGHQKLNKFLEKRREAVSDDGIFDWAFAEYLAFGSLLYEGIPIRLSGQDSVRGTFSQRHLAFTDIITGEEYLPLNHMFEKQAKIEALDSLLSEAAVLGFEYGYSTADPLTLVIWEAQFGDFANGAQIIIDNFIVASYEKWQVPNNVVMLLPHGFEGQGPEHSSARLERFLILCAQNNMEVCYPSTPAQYFHLLRRHMKKAIIRPLIIMTPKSLLRHPDARSEKIEFIFGTFNEIIDDKTINDKNKIKRILITSGKVYYDLINFRKKNNRNDVAIVRLEQFYPYDSDGMKEILSSYKKTKEIIWVQEEPKNMGGWNFVHQRLIEDLAKGQKLRYAGRPESASPAVGSSKLSAKQQQELVESAFGEF